MRKSIEELIKEKSGINLDIGCGHNKQQGFVGIDKLDIPGVDIVHDIEVAPWPLPDECVTKAVASHVLEHLSPAKWIDTMNELWRVMKVGGQFAFVVPYAGSSLYWQDPTHQNGIIETTMYYFDPDPEHKYLGPSMYAFYEPKPWKIEFLAADRNGLLECLLRKRADHASYHGKGLKDITEEFKSVKKYLVD